MKRYILTALAVTLIAGLCACGSGAPEAGSAREVSSETIPATPTDTATASPTPSPTPTRTHASRPVPEVTGKTFAEAYKILMDAEFYGYPYDMDGLKSISTTPDKSLVVVSTSPTAGTVTSTMDIQINLGLTGAAGTAVMNGADPAKNGTRYQIDCAPNLGFDESVTFHSLKEVWASKSYAGPDHCIVNYNGEHSLEKPAILPSEQKIVDIVAANGSGVFDPPMETFDHVLGLCIKLDADYTDGSWDRVDTQKAEAKAALALCPDTPHAAILRDVQTLITVGPGAYEVGKFMEPGTYRTKPGAKDCYWARTTGGGDIIANNFIGYAPAGVTVTVHAGEGFESQRCGYWTKIG